MGNLTCPQCGREGEWKLVLGYSRYVSYGCRCGGVSYYVQPRYCGEVIFAGEGVKTWDEALKLLEGTSPIKAEGEIVNL